MKKTKVANTNELPKYFSTDIEGSCVIYELKQRIDHMRYSECLYGAVKRVTYLPDENGNTDGIVEDAKGKYAESMLLEIRDGFLLPDTYGDFELCWYEEEEGSEPMDLDSIVTMAVI